MKFGFLLKILLAIALALSVSACATCTSAPVRTLDLPENNLRAVAYRRTCGNQTQPSLHVSLYDPERPPAPDAPGNIFVSLSGDYIDLRWTDAGYLLAIVDAPVSRIVKQRSYFQGVGVHYRYPTFQELGAERQPGESFGTRSDL